MNNQTTAEILEESYKQDALHANAVIEEKKNAIKTALSRKQRREIDRQLMKDGLSLKEQLTRSIKRNKQLIDDLTQLYCRSYNDYSDLNKHKNNGLERISLTYEIIATQISLLELKNSSATLDLNSFMNCTDPVNPAAVNLFYFRMDFHMQFTKDTELEVRPDVPEAVTEQADHKVKQQLFYHAVFPKPDEMEITRLKAEDKLLSDFVSHIFCSGIDMQHSSNNRHWDGRIKQQTENIHDKGVEAMKIFEEAASLKKD